jgi:RHS repeat-associated protein
VAGLAHAAAIDYLMGVVALARHHERSGDANLETRLYPLQNWRGDVVCVGRLSGGAFTLIEAITYDTYGNALSRPPVCADIDNDGGITGADTEAFFVAFEAGEPEGDVDLDGSITGADPEAFFAAFEIANFGPSQGAGAYSGVLTGYAGYVRDRWAPDLYHVRHRVYDTRMGRWTTRDPLGYVDGMNLYEYTRSRPIDNQDPSGLVAAAVACHQHTVKVCLMQVALTSTLSLCAQAMVILANPACLCAAPAILGPNAPFIIASCLTVVAVPVVAIRVITRDFAPPFVIPFARPRRRERDEDYCHNRYLECLLTRLGSRLFGQSDSAYYYCRLQCTAGRWPSSIPFIGQPNDTLRCDYWNFR